MFILSFLFSYGQFNGLSFLEALKDSVSGTSESDALDDTFTHPFSFLFSLILKSCWLSLQCAQGHRRNGRTWSSSLLA
jgi:hypothetical protein